MYIHVYIIIIRTVVCDVLHEMHWNTIKAATPPAYIHMSCMYTYMYVMYM